MLRHLIRLSSTCFPQKPGESSVRKLALIPGDGIGPEICSAATEVLSAIHAPIEFETFPSLNINDDNSIKKIKSYPAALKGTISHQVGEGASNPNVLFRKKLEVYANVCHAFSLQGIKTRHDNINVIVIRENLEGEYSGLEHEVYPGVVESIKVITYDASLKIAKYAFELAYMNNRKKVTAIHKANIMKKADGEFLKAVRQVAKEYPTIQYQEMIIDNASMQMTSNPWQFDVVVLPNLYGSIISNIVSFLVGGPGITPGVNIANDFALFEPGTRHLAKDIAGKGIANPTAILLSSAMMLRHLNLPHFAERLQEGLFKTIREGNVLTKDIGGVATTYEFTKEIIKNIQQ
ncbi:unnamed protein product [Blepharisma stoltei]|uniref:Isopropylmalate dehydrogenase-like domain-containing protein n=1 Tax=Blepharisma stoltei TaxID=1481888 RepID=A0AAU9JR02_9CILI|nr:unnamed protein product [Blepharisma stoltei]